jgi:hypothetical protein
MPRGAALGFESSTMIRFSLARKVPARIFTTLSPIASM